MFTRYKNLSDKTKEVYAKQQIDFGQYLIKGFFFCALLLPITTVISKGKDIQNVEETILSLSSPGFYALMVIIPFVYFGGLYEKHQGLSRLNKLYTKQDEKRDYQQRKTT